MNARKTEILTDLERLPDPRDRDRLMLRYIGMIAAGRITLSDVPKEDDVRQLAYLAALSRNRVETGRDRLKDFLIEATERLSGLPVPTMPFSDPLQAVYGAVFGLDPAKVRSEAEVHVRMAIQD